MASGDQLREALADAGITGRHTAGVGVGWCGYGASMIVGWMDTRGKSTGWMEGCAIAVLARSRCWHNQGADADMGATGLVARVGAGGAGFFFCLLETNRREKKKIEMTGNKKKKKDDRRGIYPGWLERKWPKVGNLV